MSTRFRFQALAILAALLPALAAYRTDVAKWLA